LTGLTFAVNQIIMFVQEAIMTRRDPYESILEKTNEYTFTHYHFMPEKRFIEGRIDGIKRY
jgi:hypothetical protein